MRELDKVLDNEKVLWEGSPQFWPFVVGNSLIVLFVWFFLFIFIGPFVGFLFSIFFLLLMNVFGNILGAIISTLISLLLFFIPPFIYQVLSFNRTHYAITDKRVIIQKGVIGRDFEIVDHDKITNAEVNVGIADKMFGKNSGSILISTAGTFTYTRQGQVSRPYTLRNISSPYEVFKQFKTISHDIKTDVYYPNKKRPKINPGYPTEYKKNKKTPITHQH